MSEANKLLDSLTDDEFSAYSDIGPVDDVLYIDAETRTINVPNTELLFGVETDKDVERKYFKCPRIVGDNVDLSKKQLRVHYQNASGDPEGRDKYIVEDVKVSGDYVTFSWKLSSKVLAYKGTVFFTVVAVSVNADGTVNKEWNTTLASGNVLEGLEVEDLNEYEEEQARDVLAQLLAVFETQKDASIEEVQNEAATQMRNIENKGAEVLATIPADYTELNKTVDQHTSDIYDLARNKANAIVGEVVGETIYVQDAAKQPPVELSVFGRTEQSDYTNGYQLFDASRLSSISSGGVTITNNGDGSFTISGSGNATESVYTYYNLTDEEYAKIMQLGNILYINAIPITCPFIMFGLYDSTGANISSLTNRQGISEKLTITQELIDQASLARFYIYISADSEIIPGTIKPMYYMEGDGTWERFSGGKPGPNPEYPFEMTNVENPKLVKLGKNLLRDSKIPAKGTMRGITCEYEGDGVFHIYGTFDSTSPDGGLQLATTYLEIPTTPDDVYTLSAQLLEGTIPFRIHPYLGIGNDTVDCKNWFSLWMEPGMKVGAVMSSTYSAGVPLTDATRIPRFWIYGYNESMEALSGDFRIKVWFEKGHDNTGHETCEENIVELPYELRGIPVSTDGNYTDSTGQTWLVDELDLERGVISQRIHTQTFDASTDESWYLGGGSSDGVNNRFETNIWVNVLLQKGAYLASNAYCDAFRYMYAGGIPSVDCFRIGTSANGTIAYLQFNPDTTVIAFEDLDAWKTWLSENPITVYIPLSKPIEIQLTEEQLAAYKQVLMSNPITTLYNSAGAPMKLKYAKDAASCIGVKTQEITLTASKWIEQDGGAYYTQVVSVSGITENTRIDLNPSPEQLISIVDEGLSMFATNQNGVVTVYAMGGKPASDMTIPINKQEVVYV